MRFYPSGTTRSRPICKVIVASALSGRGLTKVDECRSPVRKAYEHKTATADVASAGMGNSQSEPHRHRGIDSITAGFEHRNSNVRCKRFLSHNHRVFRSNRFVGAQPETNDKEKGRN